MSVEKQEIDAARNVSGMIHPEVGRIFIEEMAFGAFRQIDQLGRLFDMTEGVLFAPWIGKRFHFLVPAGADSHIQSVGVAVVFVVVAFGAFVAVHDGCGGFCRTGQNPVFSGTSRKFQKTRLSFEKSALQQNRCPASRGGGTDRDDSVTVEIGIGVQKKENLFFIVL